jgi:hypothetical protein
VQAKAKEVFRLFAVPFAVSLVVGVVTALVEAQIGIGIVAALVVAAISLQLQLIIQLSGSDLDTQMRLRELAPVAKLRDLDKSSGDFLLRLAEAETRYLEGMSHPVVFDLELEHRRTKLLEQYDECARGTMRLNLRPTSLLRETDGVSTVNKELRATSLVPASSYWDSGSGISYLEQQNALLQRGIKIKRVFIQDKASLSDLSKVVARHFAWRSEHGSDVLDFRVAFLGGLPEELINDYAIVDNSSVIRLETQLGVGQPTAVTWDTSTAAVDRAARMFERLWAHGQDPSSIAALGEETKEN